MLDYFVESLRRKLIRFCQEMFHWVESALVKIHCLKFDQVEFNCLFVAQIHLATNQYGFLIYVNFIVS